MKRGFTLAEALITLTIIGVVAAMTLPSINSNLWKSQRKALYRKMYAKLENALDLASKELGYTPQCGYWGGSGYDPNDAAGYKMKTTYDETGQAHWTMHEYNKETGEYGAKVDIIAGDSNGLFSDCQVLGALMEKHLGVMKKCTYNDNGSCGPKYMGTQDLKKANLEADPDSDALKNTAEELFPDKDYSELTSEEKEKIMNYTVNKQSSGSGMTSYTVNRTRYYLHDGSVILALANSNATGSFYPRYYAVDTNGDKGPNKWGQDLFQLDTFLEKNLKNLYTRDVTPVYDSQSHSGLKAINGGDLMK